MQKITFFSSWLVFSLASCFSSEVFAQQSYKDQLECAQRWDLQTTYTYSQRERGGDIVICVGKGLKRAALHLVAASMVGHANFPTADYATWVGVRIKDKFGGIVFEDPTFLVATVHECGGYETHLETFPENIDWDSAQFASVWMTEDKPNTCKERGNSLTIFGRHFEQWVNQEGFVEKAKEKASKAINAYLND